MEYLLEYNRMLKRLAEEIEKEQARVGNLKMVKANLTRSIRESDEERANLFLGEASRIVWGYQ